MSSVRVRFAPSPTGLIHAGGIRTILFNWLFAKSHKGKLVWRVEDTDRERLVPEAIDNLSEALGWLGIDWDEGPSKGGPSAPYIQSERLAIYQKIADQLLKSGHIYMDWTTPPNLDRLREEAKSAKKPFLPRKSMLNTSGNPDNPHVLRFQIDESYNPEWNDLVRGKLRQFGSELDDFICIKSDGFPTYNFANVVDDHLMKISHVIRGEEFVASTPKFLQLYKALGWKPPFFAHVPQVLGPDKSKLSKRHGAKPVLFYRDSGYLPEALINFLALLGWNDGTEQEVFTIKELIDKFALERVQKSPAIFDGERLNWFNSIYIRQAPSTRLLKPAENFWPKSAAAFDDTYKQKVLDVIKDRLKNLAEIPNYSDFFFSQPKLSSAHKQEIIDLFGGAKGEAQAWLKSASKLVDRNARKNSQQLERLLREEAAKRDDKPAALFGSLRIALTAQPNSPPVWDIIRVLGPKQTKQRLERALAIL